MTDIRWTLEYPTIFQQITTTFTLMDQLIKLCIDNFQEKILSQWHNEVIIMRTDSSSIRTNHKIEAKNIRRSSGRSQRFIFTFSYPFMNLFLFHNSNSILDP